MEVIATEGLTKDYGAILALDNLNLKIQGGMSVGLLGPNGAGKSTTIKLLCGLIRPTRGHAYINGFDPTKDPKNALKDVGCVIEVPIFYRNRNPIEILHYLGKLRGMKPSEVKERTRETLEIVKLSEWSKTKVKKFSRGMIQRLGVAQAILHDPSVLILDEPALGLDPRGIHKVREMMKDLIKQGKTILFASHMLYETREVCDTVALMNKGKLLTYDKVENLEKISIQTVEVETIRPPSPEQLEMIKRLEPVKSVVEGENGGTLLKINFVGDRIMCARLHATLIKRIGVPIVSFKPSIGALEEIYLKIVEE